jgi:hypothetical protein
VYEIIGFQSKGSSAEIGLADRCNGLHGRGAYFSSLPRVAAAQTWQMCIMEGF